MFIMSENVKYEYIKPEQTEDPIKSVIKKNADLILRRRRMYADEKKLREQGGIPVHETKDHGEVLSKIIAALPYDWNPASRLTGCAAAIKAISTVAKIRCDAEMLEQVDIMNAILAEAAMLYKAEDTLNDGIIFVKTNKIMELIDEVAYDPHDPICRTVEFPMKDNSGMVR
jgi:hypothetical protein